MNWTLNDSSSLGGSWIFKCPNDRFPYWSGLQLQWFRLIAITWRRTKNSLFISLHCGGCLTDCACAQTWVLCKKSTSVRLRSSRDCCKCSLCPWQAHVNNTSITRSAFFTTPFLPQSVRSSFLFGPFRLIFAFSCFIPTSRFFHLVVSCVNTKFTSLLCRFCSPVFRSVLDSCSVLLVSPFRISGDSHALSHQHSFSSSNFLNQLLINAPLIHSLIRSIVLSFHASLVHLLIRIATK